MKKAILAGVLATCLSGCATTAILNQEKESFESPEQKAAAVGVGIIADTALTFVIVSLAISAAIDAAFDNH